MSACRRFEAQLERWLAGALESRASEAAAAHLAGCAACRELVELMMLDAAACDLTSGVLAVTTGSVCDRAEEQLPPFVAGELTTAERQLVALHLDSCSSCRALIEVLQAAHAELPRLREIPPPAGFADAVVAAVHARKRQRAPALPATARSHTAPFDLRLQRWLRSLPPRLLARPRFASELAYTLTVLGILTLHTIAAIAGTPPRELLGRARSQTAQGLREQTQALARAPAVDGAVVAVHRLGQRFERLFALIERTTGTFLREPASALQKRSASSDEPEPGTSPPDEDMP